MGTEVLQLLTDGFRPDVIHAHIFSEARMAMGLARFWRIPLVMTEHWTALCREGILSRERLDFAKQVYEQSAMVLPVCDYLRKCIEMNTGASFKSRVIFNAVNTRIFFDDGRKRKKQIITVARLERAKDIPTLLSAFALLKDKHILLKIVGRGDANPFIEMSKDLGIFERVEFLGEQPKPVIAELMRESAVFVLSSLWENSPCVIGESLCCGLPVVATNVGGVPELIESQSGRLVPAGDAEAMAYAFNEVLEHPQQFNRQDITKKAHARFSYETIGMQLDKIYREVTLDL
jgi:glycosyltransferase involved in cell wall biosynthesis